MQFGFLPEQAWVVCSESPLEDYMYERKGAKRRKVEGAAMLAGGKEMVLFIYEDDEAGDGGMKAKLHKYMMLLTGIQHIGAYPGHGWPGLPQLLPPILY
jgi:hypothetical protein